MLDGAAPVPRALLLDFTDSCLSSWCHIFGVFFPHISYACFFSWRSLNNVDFPLAILPVSKTMQRFCWFIITGWEMKSERQLFNVAEVHLHQRGQSSTRGTSSHLLHSHRALWFCCICGFVCRYQHKTEWFIDTAAKLQRKTKSQEESGGPGQSLRW